MKKTKALVEGTAVLSPEAYFSLVEELNALKTEEQFDLSVRHVQWAHMWGKTIRETVPKKAYGMHTGLYKLLERLSIDVGRTSRMLGKYVELYDTYPDITVALNEHGKSVSVNLLIGKNKEEDNEPKPPCDHSCERHCGN